MKMISWRTLGAASFVLLSLAACKEKSAAESNQAQQPEVKPGPNAQEVVAPAGKSSPEEPAEPVATKGNPSPNAAAERASWADETGNFIKFRDQPEMVGPDIVAVHALSSEGNLAVVYRFAPGNLQQCFAQKPGDPPMHSGASISDLYLDLDNDASTGAKVGHGEDETGYELKLSVMTGFHFVNADNGKADAMFGDVGFPDNLTKLKPDASLVPWILDATVESRGSWSQLSPDEQRSEPRRLTVLTGDQITVYIPYQWFGMKPGDIIRISYTDEKSSNDGLSEARRVKLK